MEPRDQNVYTVPEKRGAKGDNCDCWMDVPELATAWREVNGDRLLVACGAICRSVKVVTYVCITTNQPDTKSNPNPNPTTKQHAIVIIQIFIVTWPTYPEKFTEDMLRRLSNFGHTVRYVNRALHAPSMLGHNGTWDDQRRSIGVGSLNHSLCWAPRNTARCAHTRSPQTDKCSWR